MNFKGVWEGLIAIGALMLLMAIGVTMCSVKVVQNDDQKRQMLEMVKQCEAELPRNQHCRLIAVPDVSDEKSY